MHDNVIGSIILEGSATMEDIVVTSKETTKRVIAQGCLQDMDNENRNHRIYAHEDMIPEIKGPRIKELLEAGELRGETGHPLSDSIVRQQTIDPKLCCVKYLKIWTEKDLIKAQFKGTNNGYGEEFDQDLREGCKPAFSLRALGSIENRAGKAYVRGVKIITWDRVCFPSHRKAYTEKVLSESAVLDISNSETEKMIETVNEYGRIINITGSDAKDMLNKLQRESANIGTILETFENIADRVVLEGNNIILSNAIGDRFVLPLDNYVNNLIMNHIWGL